MTKSIKIHHTARIKKRRANYWGCVEKDARRIGILLKTPKPCSCIMCRNKRSYLGDTLKELINKIELMESKK